MSLSYELTDINNYERLCWEDLNGEQVLSNVTEAIVFATMYVDIGTITKANADEFYIRYDMFCRASGMTNRLSISDIKDHIGLRTNVSTETKAKFQQKVLNVLRDSAESQLRYSKRKGGE